MTKLHTSVYEKRNKLYNASKTLRLLALDNNLSFDKYMKIRMKQDKIYQRWLFYDNIIKAINKKEPKE